MRDARNSELETGGLAAKVDAVLVEYREQGEEVVDVHLCSSRLCKTTFFEDFLQLCADVEVGVEHLFSESSSAPLFFVWTNASLTFSCCAHHDLWFASSISFTPFAPKFALTCLFLLWNSIRVRPSNSSNLIGGGGSCGTMRTTDDSTFGGGRKEDFETFMTWSHFE